MRSLENSTNCRLPIRRIACSAYRTPRCAIAQSFSILTLSIPAQARTRFWRAQQPRGPSVGQPRKSRPCTTAVSPACRPQAYASSPPINSRERTRLACFGPLCACCLSCRDHLSMVATPPSRTAKIAQRNLNAARLSWPRDCRTRVAGGAHPIPSRARANGTVAAARKRGARRPAVLRTPRS